MHYKTGYLFLSLVFISLISCNEKQLVNGDFMGEWKSVVYDFQGKTHNYDGKELLIFSPDSVLTKKIRFGNEYKAHKGGWYIVDNMHMMLAFNVDQVTGKIDFSRGFVWEIVDYKPHRMEIQSVPPGQTEPLKVTFIREIQ